MNLDLVVLIIFGISGVCLWLLPMPYFFLISPKLKEKIGVKIERPLKLQIYKFTLYDYLGIPLAVSTYIAPKFILKILGLNADKIKIGRGTLQKVNYSNQDFSFLEIFFSLIYVIMYITFVSCPCVLLYLARPEYFALY